MKRPVEANTWRGVRGVRDSRQNISMAYRQTSFNYRLGPYKWYIPLFGFQVSQAKNETEMESVINCCLPLVCSGFEPNDLQSRSLPKEGSGRSVVTLDIAWREV